MKQTSNNTTTVGNSKYNYVDEEGNRLLGTAVSDDKGHAQAGWEIVSGDNSSEEGEYYGFTIVEPPTTMNLEGVGSKFKLNGSVIDPTTNLASYFPTTVYQPCSFTKLTIDSGTIIVYKK